MSLVVILYSVTTLNMHMETFTRKVYNASYIITWNNRTFIENRTIN